jgi:hypothetical protein
VSTRIFHSHGRGFNIVKVLFSSPEKGEDERANISQDFSSMQTQFRSHAHKSEKTMAADS